MARIHVKRWEIRCDGWPACDVSVFVDSARTPDLPEGWATRKVHDCGITGYTRTDELCPACLAKRDAQ